MRALTLALTVLMLIPAVASAADRTKPTTPGNLRVTATSTTSVSLAWNASTDNSGSVTYRVREAGGTTRTTSQTNFAWTGLSPNRTYRFTVSASDPSGNRSSESNQVTATTPASVPPATPANLRLAEATVNTLTLAWEPVAGAARYELHSNVAGTYSTTETSRTAHWLQPDTGYTFTVRAFNAAGTPSATSAPVTVRTLRDTSAPKRPGRLRLRLQPVRGAAELAGVDRQLELRLLQRRPRRPVLAAHAARRQPDDDRAEPARRHDL